MTEFLQALDGACQSGEQQIALVLMVLLAATAAARPLGAALEALSHLMGLAADVAYCFDALTRALWVKIFDRERAQKAGEDIRRFGNAPMPDLSGE